jgi:hypothetical protein
MPQVSPTVPQVLIHPTAGSGLEAPRRFGGGSPGLYGRGRHHLFPFCHVERLRRSRATEDESGVPSTRGVRVMGWESKHPENVSAAMAFPGALARTLSLAFFHSRPSLRTRKSRSRVSDGML